MIHVLQATVTEQHQHRGQVDSTSCILILQFVGLVSFVLLEQTKMIASGKFVDWYIFDVLQNPRSYCLNTITFKLLY